MHLESSVGDGGGRDRVAEALMPEGVGDAVVVDVWEIFHALPVRRKAARDGGEGRLVEGVRRVVAGMAMAEPGVRVRFCVEMGMRREVLLTTGRVGAGVKLRRLDVAAVVGGEVAEAMVRVVDCGGGGREAPLSVDGFVSCRPVSVGADGQMVSLDKVVLGGGSALHRAVRAAWRRCWRAAGGGKTGGRPAFVLNFASNRRCTDFVAAAEDEAGGVRFYEPREVVECVNRVLRDTFEEAAGGDDSGEESGRRGPEAAARGAENGRDSVERSFGSGKASLGLDVRRGVKRPRPAMVKPFHPASRRRLMRDGEDPDIHAALRKIDATAVHVSARRPRSVPLPNCPRASSAIVRKSNTASRLFHGRAPLLRRPSSAAEIREGFSASAPAWKNPVFPCRGRSFGRSVETPRAVCCPTGQDLVLDLRQVRIKRDDIPTLRVVGQSDRKFIIVVDSAGVLYAVDQHAASERVHFEALQRKVLSDSGGTEGTPPQAGNGIVSLNPAQVALVRMHEEELRRWGWVLKARSGAGRDVGDLSCSGRRGSEVVYQMVTTPLIRQTGVSLDRREQLISFLDGLDGGTPSSAVPRPVVDALATTACHGAVRFGDCLTHEQCCAIVRGLGDCELPFNCAHGRPSIVPLVIL